MPDLVWAPLGAAAGWLLTYLLHSTWLIAGGALVARLLGPRPAAREVVWRVALLGGVVTATWVTVSGGHAARPYHGAPGVAREAEAVEWLAAELPDGASASRPLDVGRAPVPRRRAGLPGHAVSDDVRTLRVRAVAVPEEGVGAGGPTTLQRRAALKGVREISGACRAALADATATPTGWIERVRGTCAAEGWRWYHLLVVVWLTGALMGTLRLARVRRALADLDATLEDVGRHPRAVLAGLGGGTRVRLVCSPALAAPCALPGRRIGLPARCEEELSEPELRAVLAHELAHVERRDVAWAALLRVVRSVLWLQPLNRVAAEGAHGAAEENCDDRALARTGERVGLATSIARVAEWTAGLPPDPVPVSMAAREGPVATRVRRILTGSRHAEPRWLGLVAAAVVVAPIAWVPTIAPQPGRLTAIFVQERIVTSGPPDGASIDPASVPGEPVTVEIHVERIDAG